MRRSMKYKGRIDYTNLIYNNTGQYSAMPSSEIPDKTKTVFYDERAGVH
jgi:hypothetical protein